MNKMSELKGHQINSRYINLRKVVMSTVKCYAKKVSQCKSNHSLSRVKDLKSAVKDPSNLFGTTERDI